MTKAKRIVITGAAGQDGLILGLKLIAAGHTVIGVVRNADQKTFLEIYNPKVKVEILDSSNLAFVRGFLEKNQPDQIYHLSARSSVADSWKDSENTLQTNVFHTLNWLNALNNLKMHTTRFFHASSSEMFGLPKDYPQTEETFLHPRSPYGISKVASHHLAINYRESFGQFACTGIMFNHESPLRDIKFVTRKITSGVASIASGNSEKLTLGNVDISRDWGWAPDFVDGMILIMEAQEPSDFILSTGVSHTLLEFIDVAFQTAGISNWEHYLSVDKSLSRPADVYSVLGDNSKAKRLLGWCPATTFQELIASMVKFDIDRLKRPDQSMFWRPGDHV